MLTKKERQWIITQHGHGYATHDDLPGIPEGECIPFVSVPNMPIDKHHVRAFTLEEIFDALGIEAESCPGDGK